MNYKAELVALFGTPVAENPTGVMQEAAFAARGLNWRYLTIEVQPDALPDAIRGMRAMGFAGANLTIPHKVAVIPLLDEITREAAVIGAVNTVRRGAGGRLIGDNTDGKGFLRGLTQDAGVDPVGKRVVLLGAGGAARAIAAELLLAGVADLLVVNRDAERGAAMARDLKERTGGPVRFAQWIGTYRAGEDVDLLVNATSVGLYPDVTRMPPVDLCAMQGGLVADAVFNPAETALLAEAKSKGLRTLDGLSMLVYQGVIGFELWTGEHAPEDVMKKALRDALEAA